MQVFLNLIVNAEQAIREGRDKGTLRIRLGRATTQSGSAFTTMARALRKNTSQHFRPVLYDEAAGTRNGIGT